MEDPALPVVYLSTRYHPETKAVVIEGNANGWNMLLRLITMLNEKSQEHYHIHVDISYERDDGVHELIIEYREPKEIKPLDESPYLKPIAAKLGVTPSRAALVEYTTRLLALGVGTSRDEIHRVLEELGGEFYIATQPDGFAREEQAHWTIAVSPLGKIQATWTLKYDERWYFVSATEAAP